MANERITENIVRKHFQKDENLDDVIIEEQQSQNIKINKLLKNASKKGDGRGCPEFLINYKNRDLLIVIECKADKRDHNKAESEAKHYSSFLNKDFDVISIAVSGQKTDAKISHFLQLKGENTAVDFAGKSLLSLKNYEENLLKNEAKFTQEYHNLLDYSKELNEKLHSTKYEIPENLRALLVSGILIGLQSNNFGTKGNDGSKKKPDELAEDLVKEITRTLTKANIETGKVQNLKQAYSFITTHKQLCEDENNLCELIEDIDKNVNKFIKTYKYFDVLGKFYIEFLRYANGDKALGIVLTPPHITDFFAEITEVNKNSVIIDNCTGTGGFLISAMKKMILDAKEDEKIIEDIKGKQLIGIENKAHVFALGVSNMFIHGDGKSNVYHNSCFDKVTVESKDRKGNKVAEVKELTKLIKEKHSPTIGMLNPPYRSKKKGIQEWEFILNNLEMLEVGGRCVAIIPNSCVLAQKGEELELKKKLLEHHTLEAVFSMPEQLFYPVGVITSVVLIKAHIPHNKSYTYLGFYKDDGFAMRRHKGRLDYYGRWERVRNEWVEGFRSKQAKIGFAEVRQLKAEDEWCAEAYMKTDYSELKQEDFEKALREYTGYKVIYDFSMKNKVNCSPYINQKFGLNTEKWKEFKIEKFFKIEKSNELSGDVELEGTQLISTSYFNNGVVGYLSDGEKLFKKNCLTVACNGAAMGTTFYQDKDFYATADINILIPKFELNQYIGLFLSVIIRREKYRFNYGRKWGKDRMLATTIRIPTTRQGEPDWQFMEDYIKSLPYSSSL